jgi:hypothetical protein
MPDIVVETTTGKVRGLTVGGVPDDPAAAARKVPFMEFLHGMSGDELAQGEDCLVLNVWTAGTDQQPGRRATMVFDAVPHPQDDPRPAIRGLYAKFYAAT